MRRCLPHREWSANGKQACIIKILDHNGGGGIVNGQKQALCERRPKGSPEKIIGLRELGIFVLDKGSIPGMFRFGRVGRRHVGGWGS